jgi:hypothetical protein
MLIFDTKLHGDIELLKKGATLEAQEKIMELRRIRDLEK